ncbi:nitrate ABC transporter ATP-binding protein [Chromobacterium violaceum]|uniref:ABC transporter ATP-binding protein n=1 Tax=Chromobacterium violaceum TaxID=536 RepID=UPI000C129314|nr:ABC transporter ATP-binding protein [Chromobacterium violaceum]ATP28775.1 nitrate ABC transporter ATP-binding protein [Chromobacterium violaceum]ATP32686.1 nitrate ABC transporter ATP-binding protein [Chromobacterium violaceum]
MTPPALAFDKVTAGYQPESPIVERFDLRLMRGEFLALVGPSGCGKSTLLNLAAGLLAPDAGCVRADGRALDGLNPHAGYMQQADTLLPWKTTLDNVALGLVLRGMSRGNARERARQWLRDVGLAGCEGCYPSQLSGGMKKRAALAQALISEPPILLLDEPFSALDAQLRQTMGAELLRLARARTRSTLLITHDLQEAIALADRVVVLTAGPPCRVAADMAIGLPHPRVAEDMPLEPGFSRYHAALWRALKRPAEEACP